MRTSTLFALIVLTLCLTGRTRAAIIHVPADSATIQAGIDGAAPGDTVMVAPGRYVVYWLEWHGKGVTVMSTDPLDSVVVAATVIDGDSLDPVVYFNEGEDSTAVLTGFTITGGYASYFGLGGGILCAGSSPTISHNVITDNHVEDGGGIGCTLYSDPIIRENIIGGNSATVHGGGIMTLIGCSPRIVDNIIADNTAVRGGGGISLYSGAGVISGNVVVRNHAGSQGGGVNVGQEENTILVSANLIADNIAGWEGSGVAFVQGLSTIAGNTISGNVSQSSSGGGIYVWANGGVVTGNDIFGNQAYRDGGGVMTDGVLGADFIENNRIHANTADRGGGIACVSASPDEILHNTIVGNTALTAGGGVFWAADDYFPVDDQIRDTILWDNVAPVGKELYVAVEGPSRLRIDHSLIDGGLASVFEEPGDILDWEEGNIDADPSFAGPPDDAYHLAADSPCIDAGIDAGVQSDFEGDPRPQGYAPDIGSDETFQAFAYRVILTPTGRTTLAPGDSLRFDVYVQNHTAEAVTGDLWLTVMLPNSIPVLLPRQLLAQPNPIESALDPGASLRLPRVVWVPVLAQPGPYSMIGQIGDFPGTVVDEASFPFEVVPCLN